MKIAIDKLNLQLARQCKSLSNLREVSSAQTLQKIAKGGEITTKALGRIAKALGVDPADIVEMEE